MADKDSADLLFQIKASTVYNGLVFCILGLLGIVGYFTRRTIVDTAERDKEIEKRLTKNLDEIKADIKEDIGFINDHINDLKSKCGDALQCVAIHDSVIEGLEKQATICFEDIKERLDKFERDCYHKHEDKK